MFFQHNKKGGRPQNFKKVRPDKSFTLKQAGCTFIGGNTIEIGSLAEGDWNYEQIEGNVKILTIKKTSLGELFMVGVIDKIARPEIKSETSKIARIDWGLKVVITVSDGTKIESPQFLQQSLTAIDPANYQHSLNLKGSANCEKAKKNLVRRYEDVVSRRYDRSRKQAQDLTNRDVVCFETLNVKGTQRMWGRNISDLAFGQFWQIIEGVAKKKDRQIVFGDRIHLVRLVQTAARF